MNSQLADYLLNNNAIHNKDAYYAFTLEERAVKKVLEGIAADLVNPKNSIKDILNNPERHINEITIQNIMNRGHLSLIAQEMNDNDFLSMIEKILQTNNSLFFEAGGTKRNIQDLYNQCKEELEKNTKISSFTFGDVLLRMYTKETPFYKQINAILGNYNDKNKTTSDQIVLALLLNVAIHKAGLDKKKSDPNPSILYRGTSFGENGIINALKVFTRFNSENKVLSADDLLSMDSDNMINVANYFSKRALSTSDKIEASASVATLKPTETPFLIKFLNPEVLGDFYNVANISAVSSESEFITRLPEDVALVPILQEDSTETYKGKPMQVYSLLAVRHADIAKNNLSNRLLDLKKELISCSESINSYNESISCWSSCLSCVWSDNQDVIEKNETKEIIEQLIGVVHSGIKHADKSLNNVDKKQFKFQEKEFLESISKNMATLYNKDNAKQKLELDNIKNIISIITAVVADLDVYHKSSIKKS